MKRLSPFLSALNVRPDEEKLVISILIYAIFMGLPGILVETTAYTLFLKRFGSEAIPYIYIGFAIVTSLSGFIYTQLEERVSLSKLLTFNLLFQLLTMIMFWVLLGFTQNKWPIMVLTIWYESGWVLANLGFWSLVGRLFNLRQGKRLFGLIGAGLLVSEIIVGFLVPFLVTIVGINHLLLGAALGYVLALVMQTYIIKRFSAQDSDDGEDEATEESHEPLYMLLKNWYIVSIFILAGLSSLAYWFLDNAFFAQTESQFPDETALASFMGVFFAVNGLVTFLMGLVFTGRFINRYGLQASLLVMPIVLLIGVMGIGFVGTLLPALPLLFWFVVLTKLAAEALAETIHHASVLILYQPLSLSQRLRTEAVVESMVQPIAGGTAGVILLLLGNIIRLDAVRLSYALVIILAIWVGVVIVINRAYPNMLIRALAKRGLNASRISVIDSSSLAILQQRLNSPHVEEVIYSLNILAEAEYEHLDTLLCDTLSHPAPEVRQDVLHRLEQRNVTSALPTIKQYLKDKAVPVRSRALRTLAALGNADTIEQIEPYLYNPNPHIQQGAMVGLLRSGGIEGILIAGQRLLELVNSSQCEDRKFAAQVMGEVEISSFYRPLMNLLYDPDIQVRQTAIISAGKLKSPRLWPTLIKTVSLPQFSSLAVSSLVAGGEAVVPQIRKAMIQTELSPKYLIRLIRVCGRIRGEAVIQLLQPLLNHPDKMIRSYVLLSLSQASYQANRQETHLIEQTIQQELSDSAWLLTALADLGHDVLTKPLQNALTNELTAIQNRLFLLLSFIYDSASILRARDIIRTERTSTEKRAYALETIEVIVSGELKLAILALLDQTITPSKRLEQLVSLFPQTHLDPTQRIGEMLDSYHDQLTPWTIACALEAVAILTIPQIRYLLVKALDAPSPLVREMALWSLSRLEVPDIWLYFEQLANDPDPRILQVVAHLQKLNKGEKSTMLSLVEKVLILKTADIFTKIPEDALTDIATILEEVTIKADETIFEKGDPGNCLYIIFYGKMRVHDDAQTLGELGPREIFGEVALLEARPRSASVTALEDTHLLRLDQEPFYDLIEDRTEVARGVIRVLIQRVHLLNQNLMQSLANQPTPTERTKSEVIMLNNTLGRL